MWFLKKSDIIPLKDRDQQPAANTFEKILSHMGISKQIYSDQGSEFKNKAFQKILDNHSIHNIFTLSHAPFIEAFNKIIKNRLVQYMNLILKIGLKFYH